MRLRLKPWMIVLCIVFLMTGCQGLQASNAPPKLEDLDYVIPLSSNDDFREAAAGHPRALLLFSRPTCAYCQAFTQQLAELETKVDEPLVIFYINTEQKDNYVKEQLDLFQPEVVPAVFPIQLERNEGEWKLETLSNPIYPGEYTLPQTQELLTEFK